MPTSTAPLSGTSQFFYDIDVEIDEAYQALLASELLIEAVTATLAHSEISQAALTIVITSDEAVQELNSLYRGVNAPTDVLSFASQEEAATEQSLVLPPEVADELAFYLGDIVIAYPYASRQATKYGNTVADELRLLAVHGTLHLLGHDHDTPSAEHDMWAVQDAVLAHFGIEDLSNRQYD